MGIIISTTNKGSLEQPINDNSNYENTLKDKGFYDYWHFFTDYDLYEQYG